MMQPTLTPGATGEVIPPTSRSVWTLCNTLFVIVFYLVALIWGARQAYYWQPSMLDLILQLELAFALCGWVISDSVAQGSPIPTSARVWYFFLGIVLVPIYMISTRGWRGAGWVVVHAVGWVAVTMGTYFVFGAIIAVVKGRGH